MGCLGQCWLVPVADGSIERDTGGVTDGVGVAEHIAYARELQAPGTATPLEQQSQHTLPDCGQSAHEYCANVDNSCEATTAAKRNERILVLEGGNRAYFFPKVVELLFSNE